MAHDLVAMEMFDVVIVGASFSGLTLAHHLPRTFRILVVDAKPSAGSTVESTGLITQKTRDEFASFYDVDRFLTNAMTSICVMAPDFKSYFISTTKEPWIYQTDTRAFVAGLASALPENVSLRTSTLFVSSVLSERTVKVMLQNGNGKTEIETRFLVGADGGRSKVAEATGLDRHEDFLFGYEQVHEGDVLLGPEPEKTVYHFWFGEFSLGYGGWLSPTVIDGKKAFRIGLAKLMERRGDAKELTEKFLKTLIEKGIVKLADESAKPLYVFGGSIPIDGMRGRISRGPCMLVGDAAGFCGAFAADGIKGAVISGKEAAGLISKYLDGDTQAPGKLKKRMDTHGDLTGYYRRQLRYRWLWNLMKSNRTFTAMFDVIAAERDSFLDQFCDSKDRRQSLLKIVLKWRHIPRLVRYGWFVLIDAIRPGGWHTP